MSQHQDGRQYYTSEELAADLQQVARDLDRIPTRSEYTTHGRHYGSSLTDRFGSWDDALAAAGLPSSPNSGIRERRLVYQASQHGGEA